MYLRNISMLICITQTEEDMSVHICTSEVTCPFFFSGDEETQPVGDSALPLSRATLRDSYTKGLRPSGWPGGPLFPFSLLAKHHKRKLSAHDLGLRP